jgi:hypothetical protein
MPRFAIGDTDEVRWPVTPSSVHETVHASSRV